MIVYWVWDIIVTLLSMLFGSLFGYMLAFFRVHIREETKDRKKAILKSDSDVYLSLPEDTIKDIEIPKVDEPESSEDQFIMCDFSQFANPQPIQNITYNIFNFYNGVHESPGDYFLPPSCEHAALPEPKVVELNDDKEEEEKKIRKLGRNKSKKQGTYEKIQTEISNGKRVLAKVTLNEYNGNILLYSTTEEILNATVGKKRRKKFSVEQIKQMQQRTKEAKELIDSCVEERDESNEIDGSRDISKLTIEQIRTIVWNLNNIFSKCVFIYKH